MTAKMSQAEIVKRLVQVLDDAQLEYGDIEYHGQYVPAGYGFREWLSEAGLDVSLNYPGSPRRIAAELVTLGAVAKLDAPKGQGAKNHYYLAMSAAEAETAHWQLRDDAARKQGKQRVPRPDAYKRWMEQDQL